MYYHILIHHKQHHDESKINLTEEQLITRIINPYQQGIPIVLNGRTIELSTIQRIEIFETEDTLDAKIKEFDLEFEKDTSEFKVFDASSKWKAIRTGTDVTDRFITGVPGFLKEAPHPKKNRAHNNTIESEKIFVVHGHDNSFKDETCVFLSEIGFEPIVLHRQPDGGLTVIEKFEKYSNVRYAVVLLSPDDYGFKAEELQKPASDRKGEFRARQNVIFELGFFIGSLGRQSVCCLFKGVELPSDISGLIYKTVNKSIEEVGYEIIKELKNAGLRPQIS